VAYIRVRAKSAFRTILQDSWVKVRRSNRVRLLLHPNDIDTAYEAKHAITAYILHAVVAAWAKGRGVVASGRVPQPHGHMIMFHSI
jgi:hypothetical protein